MKDIILIKTDIVDFPLKWVNLDYFPESKADKKEIYLLNDKNVIEELIFLFYTLFGDLKNELTIYDNLWWDFCLDTWDPDKDQYNYDIVGKSDETKEYLKILKDSDIEVGYSGNCKCKNWDAYLPIILKCLTSHRAPYSPLFYSETNNFFFYFHHSGSIGLYYQKTNDTISKIIEVADKEYDVKE